MSHLKLSTELGFAFFNRRRQIKEKVFLALGKRIKTQLSENHLAKGEIEIRFQINPIGVI